MVDKGIYWKITVLHNENFETGRWDKEAVTIEGPSTLDRAAPLTTPFRIYDDDGYLMAAGRMSAGCAFEPLDHYGAPSLGATELKLYNKETRRWEIL